MGAVAFEVDCMAKNWEVGGKGITSALGKYFN